MSSNKNGNENISENKKQNEIKSVKDIKCAPTLIKIETFSEKNENEKDD